MKFFLRTTTVEICVLCKHDSIFLLFMECIGRILQATLQSARIFFFSLETKLSCQGNGFNSEMEVRMYCLVHL